MTHYPPPFYFSLLVHFIREQIKKGACSGRFAWTLTAPSARGFAPSFLSPFERTQQSSSFLKGRSFPGRRESTPLLPYQIILLVLFVGFEVSAGQRPPLPPPSSGDPKGNTSTPSSPPVKRERKKVLNIGNVIQGRLPEGSKDNPSTPSDNIPASPGVVVQGTLRINVDSFKDFKICDKQGKCHQVCFKDGTGCPSCRAPCAELCARRATKLCKFGGGRSHVTWDAFASTEEARFPEFIEQLKRICFKDGDVSTKTNYATGTGKHAFHYTCHSNKKGCKRGGRGSGGGYHHDRAFWGFVNCMDELIAAGRCPAYSCKRCRDCVNKIGYGENHNRISNWKGGGRNGLYLCNDECGGVWERVIPTNYHAKHGSGNTDWKARLQKCGRVDECPLLPD